LYEEPFTTVRLQLYFNFDLEKNGALVDIREFFVSNLGQNCKFRGSPTVPSAPPEAFKNIPNNALLFSTSIGHCTR